MIKAAISKKQGQGFDELRKYLKELTGESVSVGYFAEQGVYPSKRNTQQWSYAQLMAYHELYADQNGVQLRPIFGEMTRKDIPKLRKMLKEMYIGQIRAAYQKKSTANVSRALDMSGQYVAGLLRKRFGIRSLPRNTPFTIRKKGSNKPMIETGKLRDSLSYKNSKDNKRKTYRGEAFI